MGLRSGRGHRVVTRTVDFTLALVALIAMSPILLILAWTARLSTGSSALFRQVRVGKNGRHFIVNKFRTLRPNAPSEVNRRHAEHLATPMGRLMRRFKLDELPQLWNVVMGDMSLVGPRPIIPGEYSDRSHRQRLNVRPGLTGLWQLSRVREEPFDKNPEYDLFYVANRSLTFDLWLIWRTVLLLLTHRETKIRLAVSLWERNPSWRQLVPDRARAIPHRQGLLRSKLWMTVGFTSIIVAASPGIVLASLAGTDLVQARSHMLDARKSMGRMEQRSAERALTAADWSFTRASRRLSWWPTRVIRSIPGLGQNIEVAASLSQAGKELVAADGTVSRYLTR